MSKLTKNPPQDSQDSQDQSEGSKLPKVYIVHGWTYSLDKWVDICTELRRRGIEPVLLKVPGLTEPSQKIWDIDSYVGWLNEQLQSVQHPIVIGHSNGGRIALHFVQKYPGRLAQLILIDSAGIPHERGAVGLKLTVLRGLSRLGKPLRQIPGFRKVLYRLLKAQDYNQAPANMKQTMQHMHAADSQIDYRQLTVPVTMIWGREDTITPLEEGRQLHEQLADSRLHIIDGARHAPQATHTAEVADIIEAVVNETGNSGKMMAVKST
jgi:pimeloyl-ACP methyl ester carboxylesterase